MSEPRVTITLGRSGKVVKNGGSKRSVGEWDFDGLTSSANKRRQGDSLKFHLGHGGADGLPTAENDLRLKLMRKQRPKLSQDVLDQREKMESLRKMSRPVQHPSSSYAPTNGPHTNASGLPGRYHPGELRSLDSLGKVYSPQSGGGLRARSPDKVWRQSFVISPPRNFESRRPDDISRYGQYRGNEVLDAPRLATTAPPTSLKPIFPAVGMVSRVAPANGILPKVPSLVEEHTTVAGFLNSLGLGKYAVLFQAEEVDMTILKQMGDKDLKDMGIPMGPRKKILLTLLPPHKQQLSSLQ